VPVKEANEISESAPRFRVSISEVMGLVGLAALACVGPGFIPTEVVVVQVWVAARGGSDAARARLISLAVVLVAVYLYPLANFFLAPQIDPAWGTGPDWRRTWSWCVPVVSGVVPAILLELEVVTACGALFGSIVSPGWVDAVQVTIASLMTAAVIYALTLLAGHSRRRRAVAATLGFFNSVLGSLVIMIIIASANV
jgi:hypothetical protein